MLLALGPPRRPRLEVAMSYRLSAERLDWYRVVGDHGQRVDPKRLLEHIDAIEAERDDVRNIVRQIRDRIDDGAYAIAYDLAHDLVDRWEGPQ